MQCEGHSKSHNDYNTDMSHDNFIYNMCKACYFLHKAYS